jgi:hypothetical protein
LLTPGKNQVGDYYFMNNPIALYDNRILIVFHVHLLQHLVKDDEQFFFGDWLKDIVISFYRIAFQSKLRR